MKKMILAFAFLLAGSLAFASAEEAAAGKVLVDSKIDCETAGEEQLELIGEYLMEQMHPGAAHEAMDNMMGGEGSQSLKAAHVQMARVIYCGRTDTPVTYGGMMGMMPMMGMMGRFAPAGSMMGAYNQMMSQGAFGYGGMIGYAYNASAAQGQYWPGYGLTGAYAPGGQATYQYQQPYGMMGYGTMMGAWGLGGLLWTAFWLLAFIAVILAIVWLYQQVTAQNKGRRKG